MERKINLVIAIIAMMIFGLAGYLLSNYINSNSKGQTDTLAQSWESFAKRSESKDFTKNKLDDFEVERNTAEVVGNCFDAFKDTMGNHGLSETTITKLTRAVIFGRTALKKWVDDYDVFGSCDRIDIRFGIYTKTFIDAFSKTNIPPEIKAKLPAYIGRIGIFLWPSRLDGTPAMFGGKEIPAFNLGGLEP